MDDRENLIGREQVSYYTKSELIKEIKDYTRVCGGQKQAAKTLGIDPHFLNAVMHGRRNPGTKLLTAFGFRKVIVYEYICPAWALEKAENEETRG